MAGFFQPAYNYKAARPRASSTALLHVMRLVLSVVLLVAGAHVSAQTSAVAARPPMGWNSWDSYGLSIREAEFRSNVDWLAEHLHAFGWQYAVVDEGWYLTDPENAGKPRWLYTMSADGRYTPAIARFPSAQSANGFAALAAYVHGKGLSFGIHIIRGIPREAVERNLPIAGSSFHAAEAAERSDTCTWNPDNYGLKDNEAAQAYYNSIVRAYAAWGVDLIKIDCIAYPYHAAELRMIQTAIRAAGRPMVLSVSPGPTPIEEAADVSARTNMWRVSGDVWDHWTAKAGMNWSQGVAEQFTTATQWSSSAAPGHWPDLDMLPIGYLGPRPGTGAARQTELSPDEQRSLLTLWSIARSPLFMGGNLLHMDPATTGLLTNPEVLAVNQRALDQHQVLARDGAVVWSSRPEGRPGTYLALFNLADKPRMMRFEAAELQMERGPVHVRDVWQRQDLQSDRIEMMLPAHGSALLLVTRGK